MLVDCVNCEGRNVNIGCDNLLYEAISFTTSGFFPLQLDKVKFAKRLENILQIALSDTEMNITDIQPMEGNRLLIVVGVSIRIASLTIFLGFC